MLILHVVPMWNAGPVCGEPQSALCEVGLVAQRRWFRIRARHALRQLFCKGPFTSYRRRVVDTNSSEIRHLPWHMHQACQGDDVMWLTRGNLLDFKASSQVWRPLSRLTWQRDDSPFARSTGGCRILGTTRLPFGFLVTPFYTLKAPAGSINMVSARGC